MGIFLNFTTEMEDHENLLKFNSRGPLKRVSKINQQIFKNFDKFSKNILDPNHSIVFWPDAICSNSMKVFFRFDSPTVRCLDFIMEKLSIQRNIETYSICSIFFMEFLSVFGFQNAKFLNLLNCFCEKVGMTNLALKITMNSLPRFHLFRKFHLFSLSLFYAQTLLSNSGSHSCTNVHKYNPF